jgi:hypothetical protein
MHCPSIPRNSSSKLEACPSGRRAGSKVEQDLIRNYPITRFSDSSILQFFNSSVIQFNAEGIPMGQLNSKRVEG